jgi:hypothetical protein
MTSASRVLWVAEELTWLVLLALAIPVGVLVIMLPLALVVRLVASLVGML